jgi:SAM-dependent methyltransferase
MPFICNVCGAQCVQPPEGLGRETASCTDCGSSVRLRALMALLSQEIFGVLLILPEFPVLKGIRGVGMSDTPDLAERLGAKFDYTNTFYHQAPRLDVTNPDERDLAAYDFILSSEVMEHVPPPVERAFASLHSMLKPDGVLLLTTPYNLGGKTAEHFPELHEYTLASPGGRPVLVNRRRDGSVEVFENLAFHGGHGSTLEMRTFTEESLRQIFRGAGFREVRFGAETWAEHGIEHAGEWSLPIAARKGHFQPPATELALQYRDACRLAERTLQHLKRIESDYQRHIAYHDMAHAEWELEKAESVEWVRKVEADWDERTKWALELESARKDAIAEFHRVEACEAALRKQLEEAQREFARLRTTRWVQIGRVLRAVR